MIDVWKDLEPLRRNNKIGVEQITFGVLWEMAEGCPGRLVVTAEAIKQHFGRDASSIRAQLEKLARVKLIRLLAREQRWGKYVIDVLLPMPSHAAAKPDEQLQLPLEWSGGVQDIQQWMNEHADELPASAGVDLRAKHGNDCHSGRDSHATEETWGQAASDRRVADRPTGFSADGDFPVTRGLPRGDFPAENSKSRGEIPVTEKGGVSAGKTARGDFPVTRGLPRGDFPAPLYNVNDRDKSLSNGITRSNVQGSNVKEEPCTDSSGALGAAADRDAQLAIEARRKHAIGQTPTAEEYAACRRLAKRPMPAQTPVTPPQAVGATTAVGSMLAAALAARASPAGQKGELVNRIRGLVADPQTKGWLYGFAADLLLIHGSSSRSDAGTIFLKMESFLADLSAWREGEVRNSTPAKPLGRWLNTKVHEICADHGIPTPRDRKQRA